MIGFAQSSYRAFEGEPLSVQVQLVQDGRELQRTIEVVLITESRTAFGKTRFLLPWMYPYNPLIHSSLHCALDGSDYEPIDTFLTFSPDNTSLSVPVTVLDDSFLEPTESFALRLFPSGDISTAVFSPEVTEISIIDNDSKCTPKLVFSLKHSFVQGSIILLECLFWVELVSTSKSLAPPPIPHQSKTS